MNFKMNLVALAALVAAGAAHAELKYGDNTNVSDLGSSVLFVAQDNALAKGSFSADLGRLMADLLPSGALNSGATTTATWNLATNAVTVNGVAQSGTYAYSAQWSSFQTLVGSGYKWGVIAGDSYFVFGGATDGQSVLYTTSTANRNFTVSDDAIFQGSGNIDQYIANNQGLGTHPAGGTTSTVNGAATVANSGPQFLGTTLAAGNNGSFGTDLGGNNFLNSVGTVAVVMRSQFDSANLANTTYQLGAGGQSLTAIADGTAATFSFDGTTLTYQVSAVPEPQTYAMLLAGLAAVGFVARRRRAAR